MAKDGIVHSLVVTLGLKPIYPKIVDDPKHYKPTEHARMSSNGISYLARFQNGRPGKKSLNELLFIIKLVDKGVVQPLYSYFDLVVLKINKYGWPCEIG
jgi:hypothetical protein